ncbi:MAG: sterol desaturase family protein [Caulobacterales bacterium]|nr:sterol desaturase family protein [Caulobacterales bacterium]
MSVESLEQLGANIDDAFFLFGAAIFAIEILKALFTRTMRGRGLLDMVASASTQIPYLLVEVLILAFAYAAYVVIADTFVTWTFPITVVTIVLALLAADFVYYWEHRIAHEVRLLWTQHAVHHSSRYMNMIVAVRFGPFEGVVSALFHLPLVLIGFPPALVFFGMLVVLAYQTWIHTEVIGRLGPLDRLVNTPSNHRVHHGCDEKYLDKNYGGILMIWDQLFGTYQREEETPRYGLKRDFDSVNPFAVWFSELPGFVRDVTNVRSRRELRMRVFGRPDWRPEPDAASDARG